MLLQMFVIFVHAYLSQKIHVIATVTPAKLFQSLPIGYDNSNAKKLLIIIYPDQGTSKVHKYMFERKRSAASSVSMPRHQSVCESEILYDFEPKNGYDESGALVEIQQDSKRMLITNFVECKKTERSECYAIDRLFASECYTRYAFRPAGIRPFGSKEPFKDGKIKVPVTCECRVRRKTSQP